jgi:FkbM family methyltransferase
MIVFAYLYILSELRPAVISYQSAPKVIVGAGGAAWWVLQGFSRNSLAIDGFVVTQEYGISETCGYRVYSPSTWDELPHKRSEYVAIIGIMNPEVDILKIADDLKSQGWGEVVFFSDFAARILAENNINCSMLDPGVIHADSEVIQSLRGLFVDSESKDCLDYFLDYVLTFTDNDNQITPNPYFVQDLPRWKSPLRILDCGAFDGDTIRQAIDNGYVVEEAICFEPDFNNFQKLISNTNSNESRINLPVAVGSKAETLTFSAQSSSGSQVVEGAGTPVQCITIDSSFVNWKPNLIKMDIEGSEFQALLGAEATIRNSRPNLAISIYHRSSDIVQIPLWLKAVLGNNVGFYLRRHSRTVADTVLYVFPE